MSLLVCNNSKHYQTLSILKYNFQLLTNQEENIVFKETQADMTLH